MSTVRSVYSDRIVADDRAHEDFGLVLGQAAEGVRPIPFVAAGCRPLLRSRSLERLLWNLDARLRAHSATPQGTVRLDGLSAVTRDEQSILVSRKLLEQGSGLERELQSHGMKLADAPSALMAVDCEAVSIPEPLGHLSAATPPPPDLVAPPGSYRIRGVLWDARDTVRDSSRAQAVVRTLRTLAPVTPEEAPALLQSLAHQSQLFGGSVVDVRDRDLVERLEVALSG